MKSFLNLVNNTQQQKHRGFNRNRTVYYLGKQEKKNGHYISLNPYCGFFLIPSFLWQGELDSTCYCHLYREPSGQR